MSTRDEMISAIKEHVVPHLRAKGFKGSFPHFRRVSTSRIDLLTFQFDKWGGGFVVEIAQCGPEGVTMYWGRKIIPAKVTAHDVDRRLRLGSSSESEDHWFRFDSGQDTHDVALGVIPWIDGQAEKWWGSGQQITPGDALEQRR
jgi:hypothetical protein